MKRQFVFSLALMLGTGALHAQWMETGNSGLNQNTFFLGTTDNEGVTLRTDDIMRMRLYGTQNSTINTSFNVRQNGYLGISNQPLFFSSTVGPFSRLHLADSCNNNPIHYAQVYGFRPWMRNGITFTGNQDQSYIGQKYAGKSAANDSTDMVIQWSDNDDDSPWPTDRLRFLFTDDYDDSSPPAYGATSMEGLESFRIFVPNDTAAFVGIGDFHKATVLNSGTMVDPTERLDVLDGRVRIRELPDDDECEEEYLVMVVDASGDPGERGVVKWVDPADLPTGTGGGGDCDWVLGAPGNVMYTASDPIGSTTNCPEADWSVGIGTGQPSYKLDVQHSEDNGDMVGGIRSLFEVEDQQQGTAIYAGIGPVSGGVMPTAVGIDARVADAGDNGVGVSGEVRSTSIGGFSTIMQGVAGRVYGPSDASGYLQDARGMDGRVYGGDSDGEIQFAIGVNAEVHSDAQMNYATGVASWVEGEKPSERRVGFDAYVEGDGVTSRTYGARLYAFGATGQDIGVYAEASGQGDLAGYFVGDVTITGVGVIPGGTWTPSDESLKTNVEPITDATATLAALNAVSYEYLVDQHPNAGLPEGYQSGLLIQDVEPVLPHLVREVSIPADYDSLGNELTPAETIKAMNYTGLIPYLLAGIQEQQQVIASMQQQMANMQEQLASCCAASPTENDQRSGGINTGAEEEKLTPAQERLLRIAPNPFTDRTTLFCNLERAGRMQLMANSSDGRDLIVLAEGQREAGEFQHVWSTENLAPGVYYITLLLDGETMVKRGVKVGN